MVDTKGYWCIPNNKISSTLSVYPYFYYTRRTFAIFEIDENIPYWTTGCIRLMKHETYITLFKPNEENTYRKTYFTDRHALQQTNAYQKDIAVFIYSAPFRMIKLLSKNI